MSVPAALMVSVVTLDVRVPPVIPMLPSTSVEVSSGVHLYPDDA